VLSCMLILLTACIFRVEVCSIMNCFKYTGMLQGRQSLRLKGRGKEIKHRPVGVTEEKWPLLGPQYRTNSSSSHTSTLKMEAICSSKMSVPAYKTTHCHNSNSTIWITTIVNPLIHEVQFQLT
jgi:hypothetical protein